ncbi:MAG: hypothetical protein QOG03_1095 [Actinomycetota bacterium]|nr:hypothetical protein [Actinomycetota bacterium]
MAQAPTKTLAARRAQVAVATPTGTLTGVLSPSAAGGTIGSHLVEPGAAAGSLPELLAASPYLAIDLVRGRTRVETYGGAEVRGHSTFRYDLDVSPADALGLAPEGRRPAIRALMAQMRSPTLFVDVWVDERGRLLRVQLPADPNEKRPGYLGGKLVAFVTVDLFGFQ